MASQEKVPECCLQGVQWDGKPTGSETTLGSLNTYVVGPPDSTVAILLVHDMFGWTLTNLRLIADYLSREVGARVWIPDFFEGEVIDPSVLVSQDFSKVDLAGFAARNGKLQRRAAILSAARTLRETHGYKRLGALGQCYGGWAVFNLGAAEHNPSDRPLVDCIATAHPTWLTEEEMQNVAVPVQIQAPEFDHQFTPELKAAANRIIPTLGVAYEYLYFPGMEHSFAVKGNLKDEKTKRAMTRALEAGAYWFRHWLNGEDEEA